MKDTKFPKRAHNILVCSQCGEPVDLKWRGEATYYHCAKHGPVPAYTSAIWNKILKDREPRDGE
jgi:hypothetical protein